MDIVLALGKLAEMFSVMILPKNPPKNCTFIYALNPNRLY